MRVVFAGSPDFSVPTLNALVGSEHQILGVYSQPDKPKGRGKSLEPTPVKAAALANGLAVFTPANFKELSTREQLGSLKPDVMVVVAYGLILPESVLEIPTFGCINIHASLLPHYRGASPMQAALLNGDKETGVSLMQMDKGMDTGDVIACVKTSIDKDETLLSLHDKLSTLGSDKLLEILSSMHAGNSLLKEAQDDTKASHAPKIKKEDGLINWQESAESIERKVRAYFPWPMAHFKFENQFIKILNAEVLNLGGPAGEVLEYSKSNLVIGCGQQALSISSLQLPGKRAMNIEDCFNGRPGLFEPGMLL